MTTLTASTTRRGAAASSRKKFGLFSLFGLARQRRELGQLDAHLLRDLGISPEDARSESRRGFWDVPRNWRV